MAKPLQISPEGDLRALDLFERLLAYPGNARFRQRLLRRESAKTLACLARIEAGHAARATMPTEHSDWTFALRGEPPDQIGPFRLAERIGFGGMGEVWRGERIDGLFEQTVAIKLIQSHLSDSAADAFDSERRILAKLDHPDIVRLTDGGVTDDGLRYFIMDYVDGVPFDVAAEGLPLDQRIRLFRQAAATIQFAHSRLIAHADLKPTNILVDRDGRVRLLDFGISSLLSGDGEPVPSTGAMTCDFASPQRLAGAPPSIADDVFALGRTLALIVGRTGDTDLIAIIAKATAADEFRRYETVAALSADLERWQTGLPVNAHPDGLSYRGRKFVTRYKAGVTASALAIVALVGMTVYATFSAVRAERERQNAAARYTDAHGIANYLMFDLMERMENQPRSLGLRMSIAAIGQHYLNRLARVPDADNAARLDTARGFWRLAEFQSKARHPNLGQPGPARANLNAALAIINGLTGMPVDILRAHILLDQEGLAADADNDLKRAEKLLTQARPIVMRAASTEPILLQLYFHQLANLRSWQGRYAEEMAAAKAGLALPPIADPLQAYAMRDSLLDIYGDSLYNMNAKETTLRTYAEQVALGEAAHRRWASNQMVASRLMYARQSQGMTLNAMGHLPQALIVLNRAGEEARAAMAFEPADRWTVAQQFSIETTRAQTLAFMGRMAEAMAIYRDWENRKRKAWEANPKKIAAFRSYIQVRAMIGEAQARARNVAGECRTDILTLGLYRRMKALGALTKWDEDMNLAQLEARLAKNCAQLAPNSGNDTILTER